MKFFLLFMFITVAWTTRDIELMQSDLARTFARAFRIEPKESLECVRKSEATIEDMRYMEDTIDLSDSEATNTTCLKKASCAVVCCAQKAGIMVGGEVQLEELDEFFHKNGMPKEIEIAMRSFAHICKEQVSDTSDECMAGYKFFKCMYYRTSSMVQHK